MLTMAIRGRLTDVAGVAVGHWTDPVARTGCTVVLLPEGTVASGEVRGGAPATRDLALLEPDRTVDRVDALVLTGGSAFGLASVDGVMKWLEEHGRGWPTPAGRVPIVAGLALFDLAVGDPSVRPGPAEGRVACDNATGGPVAGGDDQGVSQQGDAVEGDARWSRDVGAGAGCTTNKWLGADHAQPGGLVSASGRLGEVVVAVMIAVNAWGSVGGSSADAAEILESMAPSQPFANTTIGAVVTNARLDKTECLLLAQAAHDGLARAVFPAHGRADGDAFIAASTGEIEPTPVRENHAQVDQNQVDRDGEVDQDQVDRDGEVDQEEVDQGGQDSRSKPGFTIDALRILTVATVERAILTLAP